MRRSKYRGLFTKWAWGRREATVDVARAARWQVERPDLGTPLDLGPVVSVAPDPGDQPWELAVIPTAIHMDLVG